MLEDYAIIHIIFHLVVAIGSPVFFLFMAVKHRTASRWIRCVFVFLASIGVGWGILGVLRLGFPAHFTRATRWSFDHYETLLGGFALGLFTSLLLSSEFWQIAKPHRNRSNKSLEPTAGRRDAHI
jgi:hypothetical protein